MRKICPNGARCIPADCCFSELALYKSNEGCRSSTKRTSPLSSHQNVTCSFHDITENFLMALNNHSSLTFSW